MALLDRFAGRWHLDREVRDYRADAVMRYEGEARFDPDGAGLTCRETGIWTHAPWGRVSGARTSLWRPHGTIGIVVLFDDGRPFHDFTLQPGTAAGIAVQTAEAAHDCPPDRYEVRYTFALPERWEAIWRVTGPRKDYLTATRFVRG